MHPSDQAIILEAVVILRHCDSPNYALEKAEAIVREAFGRVDPFLPSGVFASGIEQFASSLLQREI